MPSNHRNTEEVHKCTEPLIPPCCWVNCGCDCPFGSCLSPMTNQERTAMFFICFSCFFVPFCHCFASFASSLCLPCCFESLKAAETLQCYPPCNLQHQLKVRHGSWQLEPMKSNCSINIDLRAVASCSNLKAMHAASIPYHVFCSDFTSLQKSIPSLNVPVAEFWFW